MNKEISLDQKKARAVGSLLGLVCGDALGSTVEFTTAQQIKALYGSDGQTEMRGGGSFNWKVGEYTDDGQMMMCLLNSLVNTNALDDLRGVDVDDLGQRFVAWLDSHPKDIGTTTRAALRRLKMGINAQIAGDANPNAQANGAVMRSAPVAVLWHKSASDPYQLEKLVRDSLLQSYPTHRSTIAAGAAVVVNLVIAHFIAGQDFEAALEGTLISLHQLPTEQVGNWANLLQEWNNSGRPHRGNTGWAVSTVLTALHCLATTSSAEDAIIKAVNGGDDADTVGAVTGAMAGALYGVEALPARWLWVVKDRELIRELGRQLFELGENGVSSSIARISDDYGEIVVVDADAPGRAKTMEERNSLVTEAAYGVRRAGSSEVVPLSSFLDTNSSSGFRDDGVEEDDENTDADIDNARQPSLEL